MLLAQYEKPIVPLKEICSDYFGLSYQTARQRANSGMLPIPVFRTSQKSDYLVHLTDLASYIDQQREKEVRRLTAITRMETQR
ncbi:pyocin activator PrtN family protein [Aeromonas salmonicida]|uniref:pyocin activator PrtN family protein n=1 Tax=Aeromonas salmonicida TaxID=645 RepID=UPI003D01CB1A